jgi:uncharacterized protein (TIGR04255 family)
MVDEVVGPFDDPAPPDVPLSRAPLARVLAQIRFPVLTTFFSDADGTARRIALALAGEYPLYEEGHETSLIITPEGVTEQRGAKLWRLKSADRTWQVSFAHNFISLDTTSYLTRDKFVARLDSVWAAFTSVANPPVIERVGVRYVNRVVQPEVLRGLSSLVRPEIAGVLGNSSIAGRLDRALSEAHYVLPDNSHLLGRWGLVPPDSGMDMMLPALPVASWVLDLDAFREWPNGEPVTADVGTIVSDLGVRAYQFFRWAVTTRFLEEFGGSA